VAAPAFAPAWARGGDEARAVLAARADKAGNHEVRAGEMRAMLVANERCSAPPASRFMPSLPPAVRRRYDGSREPR